MHSFHINDEYYIGNDADAKASFLWQLGVKFETHASHVLLDTTVYISFALNEAGQFGYIINERVFGLRYDNKTVLKRFGLR